MSCGFQTDLSNLTPIQHFFLVFRLIGNHLLEKSAVRAHLPTDKGQNYYKLKFSNAQMNKNVLHIFILFSASILYKVKG